MGSIFRIESIEPLDDCNAWRIKLLLTADKDPELARLTHHMQSQIGSLGISSFILLLFLWGKYKEIKELGDLTPRTIPEDVKTYFSTILAASDLALGKIEDGIGQLLSVVNIRDKQSHMPRGNKLNNYRKFMLYYMQGEWDLAIKSIEEVVAIETCQTSESQQEWLGFYYMLIGKTRCRQGRYSDAMTYASKAYELCKSSLPETHPYLASCLQLILVINIIKGQTDQQSAISKEIVKVQTRSLSQEHPENRGSEMLDGFLNHSSGNRIDFLLQNEFFQSSFKQTVTNTTNDPISLLKMIFVDFIENNTDEALSRINKVIEITQGKNNPLDQMQFSQIYFLKAKCHLARNELAEAMESYNKAFPDALVHVENVLKIQVESLPSTDSNIANTRMWLGLLYCQQGNADRASIECGKCLEMDLTACQVPLAKIANAYCLIGDLYELKKENLKALSSFQESLRISESCLPIDQLQCAKCYQCIGLVLCKLQKFSDALENFKFAMDIGLQVVPPTDPSIAAIWKRIGFVYAELNNYERAVFAFKASFEIEHAIMPMLKIEALSRSMVQEQFFSKRQHQDPLTNWRQFLEFQASSLHSDHPDLIFTYRMIGCTLVGQKKHVDALCNFQRALDIRLKCSSRTDPEVAKDYWCVGINYMLLEQFDNALSSLKTCLSIQTISLPSYHCDLADTHKTIGEILQKQQKLAEALDNYESALKILFQSFSSTNLKTDQDSIKHRNSSLADIYVRIGDIHFEKEHLFEALVNYQLVLDVQLECTPRTHPMSMHAVQKSGIIYHLLGRYQEALIAYNEYLNLQLITLSPEHIDLAYTYQSIGNIQVKQQQYDEALSSYEKCLVIQTNSLPSNHLQIAYTFILISELLMKQGKFAQCPAYLDNSLSILLNEQPLREADIARVRRMIAKVNSKLA
ncbi:unnamed protein product [Rotaria magnacalcarata]|uniref:Uncharacterized protein n=2 Tax=Rotaria magnacalcarata TaxID=392030 RepID=A0A814TAU3_9BILA|nr:unnamed protein product [Rotaria magnacalcarata]